MANSIWIGKRKRSDAAAPQWDGPDAKRSAAAADARYSPPNPEPALPAPARPLPSNIPPPQPPEPDAPRRHLFSAEIDLTELDARLRPGLSWSGRAIEISRSHLVFRSRRMCYEERRLLIAVHLIDASPVALYGEVVGCDYDGEGLYRTDLALMNVPELEVISDWIASRAARGTM